MALLNGRGVIDNKKVKGRIKKVGEVCTRVATIQLSTEQGLAFEPVVNAYRKVVLYDGDSGIHIKKALDEAQQWAIERVKTLSA